MSFGHTHYMFSTFPSAGFTSTFFVVLTKKQLALQNMFEVPTRSTQDMLQIVFLCV